MPAPRTVLNTSSASTSPTKQPLLPPSPPTAKIPASPPPSKNPQPPMVMNSPHVEKLVLRSEIFIWRIIWFSGDFSFSFLGGFYIFYIFFRDVDPDRHSLNLVDPDPHTIKPDPHPWFLTYQIIFYTKMNNIPDYRAKNKCKYKCILFICSFCLLTYALYL